MTGTDYMFICIIAGFACFGIWVFTPHFRRTMAATEEMEKQSALQEIELERERIKLAAEKARLEQELGVSLDPPEPEIVYVDRPVYQDSGGMSEGTKTAVKIGAAGAAGYAIGRKLF